MTEPIFCHLKDAHSLGFRAISSVDLQVHVTVYDVLDSLLASELTTLIDLPNDDDDGVGLLGKVGQEFHRSNRSVAVPMAISVHAIIDRLEGVDEEEELLIWVLTLEATCML